ncbi:hypothetical protein WMY93_012795 [Mugilogobius chulae]|uniref:Uncharacterized protein n=1 Tax=Mugilogobius chulae TaxID=88201 RepID=A0AAW0P4A6_9GOBI
MRDRERYVKKEGEGGRGRKRKREQERKQGREKQRVAQWTTTHDPQTLGSGPETLRGGLWDSEEGQGRGRDRGEGTDSVRGDGVRGRDRGERTGFGVWSWINGGFVL